MFKPNGQMRLKHFIDPGSMGPVTNLLGDLHRQGGSPARHVASAHVAEYGPSYCLNVHPAVLEETLVFGSHKRSHNERVDVTQPDESRPTVWAMLANNLTRPIRDYGVDDLSLSVECFM
ncbi:MAG: hypothetical protein RhofKO_32600 [Rhodothermales bacterium]